MPYTETRPPNPEAHGPFMAAYYRCSEQFRRRSVDCGPPVLEAFLPSKKRSPDDVPGRWWALCQYHADRRGVSLDA